MVRRTGRWASTGGSTSTPAQPPRGVTSATEASGRSQPEIHVFVLWERARRSEQRIVRDLARRFRLLDVVDLHWSEGTAARHFTRLYGQPFPPGSPKLIDCGTGDPLVVVVADPAPAYGRRAKWGWSTVVNTHLFDAKDRYRLAVRASAIHCSTTAAEAEHDLFFLLGTRPLDHLDRAPGPRNASPREVTRDLTGNGGWSTMAELMRAVELTTAAVTLPPLGDADFRLLSDPVCVRCQLAWVVAEPPLLERPAIDPTGTLPVKVAGRALQMSFETVGDGTRPAGWQRGMLARRQRTPEGNARLHPDDVLLEAVRVALLDAQHPTRIEIANDVVAASTLDPPGSDRQSAATWLAEVLRSRGEDHEGTVIDDPRAPIRSVVAQRIRARMPW
jgi:hypothetical protein